MIYLILSIIGAQMILCPLSPMAIAAGMKYGFWYGLLAVSIGTNIGAIINFLIVRAGFKKIKGFNGIEDYKTVALLRYCPIPFGLANYTFGASKVSFKNYVLGTLIGILPLDCFYVLIGATSRDIKSFSAFKVLLLVFGVVIFIYVVKHIKSKARGFYESAHADQ